MSWSVVQSDAIEWLNQLPNDSLDLLFTSPPYELARTYGIGDKMVGGQAWVDWMVAVVRAAAPKVKGLIAINCEGQTRNYAYSGVPFLLFADLHRAGFTMRKPCVYRRNGIPGSGGRASQHADNGGGADWLRNDWEPIICISRPGKLPWADGTACGHTPKYAPGGAMSHRLTDGTRVGKWGRPPSSCGAKSDGSHIASGPAVVASETVAEANKRLKGHATSGTVNGDTTTTKGYDPPVRANPGNVIDCIVGGHLMGHEFAHKNEAPFPLTLAEFFVRSFCPPNGMVGDCFLGSGTTGHAAKKWGRNFMGCDVRQSQVDLSDRRLATVTTELFV